MGEAWTAPPDGCTSPSKREFLICQENDAEKNYIDKTIKRM